MNQFDAGAQRVPHGWLAYFRKVHLSENTVLRDGKHDIIFATEAEALRAANKALCAYLNSPITGVSSMGGNISKSRKAAADRLFKKGGGSIEVERKGKVTA